MEIRFLGTGAADWDWTLPLAEGVRGSTATLLDGHILIDAGPTVLYRLEKEKIALSQITDVLITHSHSDHYHLPSLLKIAAAPRNVPLKIYASQEALRPLQDRAQCIPLNMGETFPIENLKIMALFANHAVEDPLERTWHFLIETGNGKLLLYALDGGWMISATRSFLMKKKLDMVIWDATSGNHRNDWRFADHNELWMIANMREALSALGVIHPDTVHVFDHVARTLWPEKPEERLELSRKFHGLLAEDGMRMEL